MLSSFKLLLVRVFIHNSKQSRPVSTIAALPATTLRLAQLCFRIYTGVVTSAPISPLNSNSLIIIIFDRVTFYLMQNVFTDLTCLREVIRKLITASSTES